MMIHRTVTVTAAAAVAAKAEAADSMHARIIMRVYPFFHTTVLSVKRKRRNVPN
jgi:hypothetical protein